MWMCENLSLYIFSFYVFSVICIAPIWALEKQDSLCLLRGIIWPVYLLAFFIKDIVK